MAAYTQDQIVEPSIDNLKKIVSDKNFLVFQWYDNQNIMIDLQTANVLVTIYNALSEKNQALFPKMLATPQSFAKLVDFAWSHVK